MQVRNLGKNKLFGSLRLLELDRIPFSQLYGCTLSTLHPRYHKTHKLNCFFSIRFLIKVCRRLTLKKSGYFSLVNLCLLQSIFKLYSLTRSSMHICRSHSFLMTLCHLSTLMSLFVFFNDRVSLISVAYMNVNIDLIYWSVVNLPVTMSL